MIVILTYYSDGSEPPFLRFFPYDPSCQTEQVLKHVTSEMSLGKRIEVFRVIDANEDVEQIVVV